MKALTIVLCSVVLCVMCSCKSSPTSPSSLNSGKPFITIIPDSIRASEFTPITLKAKITNYDLGQVYFLWDMGDGSPVARDIQSFEKIYSYSSVGTFTLNVKAYDIYSDSVVAT